MFYYATSSLPTYLMVVKCPSAARPSPSITKLEARFLGNFKVIYICSESEVLIELSGERDGAMTTA